MNVLKKVGLCLGEKGTAAAVDRLCKESNTELKKLQQDIVEVKNNHNISLYVNMRRVFLRWPWTFKLLVAPS